MDNTTQFLDCSGEVCEVQQFQNNAWLANDIETADYLTVLEEPVLEELQALAESLKKELPPEFYSTPTALTLSEQHTLPHTRAAFTKIRETVDSGIGFAVADKLPIEDTFDEIWVAVFWALGQLMGQPVAQKHNGMMIYDVHNSGAKFEYGIRGSVTDVELNFHTDNAFGQATPEYVGLFCRHPAKEGGVSRFCNLYALHNDIGKRYPKALERLYQPMYYDRQKEHAENDAPVTWAPYFSARKDQGGRARLRARANVSLVRKGYEVAGIQMDAPLKEALGIVDDVSQQPQYWYEASLVKGQIQYLNNQEIGHYRSQFTDYDQPEKKRHLYRLWHRNHGHWSYHGQSD